jgi:type VI secretion system protein ImpF
MREPRPIPGGRALLFDRLVDLEPASSQESPPFRVLDRQALEASVRREVARALNTRCPRPERLEEEGERTVLNYGVPDFSFLAAARTTDRERLAEDLAQAVAAYEPRLSQVRVALDPVEGNPTALAGRIEAVLAVGMVREAVTFPLLIQVRVGEIALQEPG